MEVYSLSEARKHLKELFDKVYFDKEDIIIHRKSKESVVVIPLEEYNALKETLYLLRSQANRDHLLRSLKQAKRGDVIEKEIE